VKNFIRILSVYESMIYKESYIVFHDLSIKLDLDFDHLIN